MISVNLGKVIATNGGVWSSSTSYSTLVYVKYLNAFYLSKVPNTNKRPDISTTEWQVVMDVNSVVINAENATQDAVNAAALFTASIVNSKNATSTTKVYSTKYVEEHFAPTNVINEINSKLDNPLGNSDEFIKGDGSLQTLTVINSQLSGNYTPPTGPDIQVLPFDNVLIDNNLLYDNVDYRAKLGAGIYKISTQIVVNNTPNKRVVLHLFDVTNSIVLVSSIITPMDHLEHTLNCSTIVNAPIGGEYCAYIEYEGEPEVINDSPIYPTNAPFIPMMSYFLVEQIS